MSENMKEDNSLKVNTDQELELFKSGKQKESSHKNSVFELVMTIFIIIIFLCILIYFLFVNQKNYTKKTEKQLGEEEKENENQQNKNKKKNPSKHKHKLNEEKNKDITCDEGFYMPTDDTGDNKCLKCSVENCSKCSGNKKKNICSSCMASFMPIYSKKKHIKNCVKMCEEGENEKCLKCKENECRSCNIGYKLKKGKCILNHSIKAIFKTNHKKENIILINKNYINDIVELIIDDENVTPSYNHTFPTKGKHKVFMSLKNDSLDSGKMMFFNITNLISINFTSEFGSKNMINMRGMFKNCINLKSIELSNFNTSNVIDFSYMFDNCTSLSSVNLSLFDTKKARDISYMFSNCLSLSSISLNSFNTINVKDMTGLFYGCSSLKNIDLTNLKTQNTEFMLYMFGGCFELHSIDISSFDTKNVKDLSYMFENCSGLKNIDLSKFNTQNVTNIDGIFTGCSSLRAIDLSNFKTKNIKNANKMFYGCKNLKKIDISSFKNVTWNIKDALFDENIAKSGKIKIDKNVYNQTKNNIPSKWKIVEVR